METATALYKKAIECEKGRNFREAIALYEKVIDNNGYQIAAVLRLASLYESLKLYQKSLDIYHKGLSLARGLKNYRAESYISFMMLSLIDFE